MDECVVADLVTQTLDDNCVSSCLSMILDRDIDKLTQEFHEDYMNHKITISEYLKKYKVPHRRCFSDEISMEPGYVYLICAPSLNNIGGLHELVVQVTSDSCWYLIDPNEGKQGRKVYDFETLKSWVLDVEIKVEDLIEWKGNQSSSWLYLYE